jgi:hypothetical protein
MWDVFYPYSTPWLGRIDFTSANDATYKGLIRANDVTLTFYSQCNVDLPYHGAVDGKVPKSATALANK